MEISYVFAFKNCEAYFYNFWDSFTEYHFTDGEFFFVDLGSTDNSANEIEAVLNKYKKGLGKYRNLTVEILPHTPGVSRPTLINKAINKSTGDVVFIGTTGMAVFYDWFKYMTSKLEPEDVAAVGSISNLANPHQSLQLFVDSLGVDVSKLKKPAHYSDFLNSYYTNTALEVPFLESFGLMVKRSVFGSVGTFDEDMATQIVADMDFCYRVRRAGKKILLAKDVFTYEAVSVTQSDDVDQNKVDLEKDLELFRKKIRKVYGLKNEDEVNKVLNEMNINAYAQLS